MWRFLLLTALGSAVAMLPENSEAQSSLPPIVTAKCSGCHQPPRPGSMPRHAWPRIMKTMVELMQIANVPINQSEYDALMSFYKANSPEKLAVIADELDETGMNFTKRSIGPMHNEERPQITSLKFADLDGDGKDTDLVVTDNNSSGVYWLRREKEGDWSETRLAEIPAPVTSTPFDFDGDGDTDIAVSAMGIMHPNDKLIGEFHILINDGKGSFEQRTLLKGVPRITDCAPGDYDGDGDLDFVVALFGWRYTGMIGLLRQDPNGEFKLEPILEINGAMRIIRNDANGDGKADFVALITQQHESIVQFTNIGGANFTSSYIARANHPAFGSSSIFLQDLDQDGDEDLLYTNGDMMDENPEPKPYHGVRWLENDGTGKYQLHYIAGMPGCYDAKPVDMDGDGDLDVVYSALYFQWDQHDFPTLAWAENTGDFREFKLRKIAYDPTNLANIAIGDINGDGKPDIVGGGMHVPGPITRKGRLTLWTQE